MQAERVRVVRERRDQIAVFEEVPAKVCHGCGHRWFGLRAVRRMEAEMQSAAVPRAILRVPVYALSDA
jgi:YgiT-type zinc finger domain-containing protein